MKERLECLRICRNVVEMRNSQQKRELTPLIDHESWTVTQVFDDQGGRARDMPHPEASSAADAVALLSVVVRTMLCQR
jgi:hypothetical protein